MRLRPIFRLCLPTQPPTLVGIRSADQPSSQSPTCVGYQPSGPAFRLIFDLRLRSTFRLRLPIGPRPSPPADPPACPPTDPQLAPSINLPAQPSSRSPACAFVRPSGSAFEPNLRLSSAADPFGAALRPTGDLRHRPTFRPCLTDQTSDTGCCISGSAFRPISDLRLRPAGQPGL